MHIQQEKKKIMQAQNSRTHPPPFSHFSSGPFLAKVTLNLFEMSLDIFSCRITLDSAASSQYFVPTGVELQYQGKC